MLVVALTEQDRRQLALALDLLARRLRADGFQPTPPLTAMRETLAATDSKRLERTNSARSVEMPDHGPVLYDFDECADRMHLSRKTIERAAASGALPTVTFGRARRVHPDALDNFARHGLGRTGVAIELSGPNSTKGAA